MLFLQENVTQNTGNVSIMEANSMLIEAMMQLNSLNEAALQADFSIRSGLDNGILTESEEEQKKEGLFRKVKDKLATTYGKVRDALVKFFKAVFLRIRHYLGKILTLGKGTLAAKEPVELLNKAVQNLSKHIGFLGVINDEKIEAMKSDVGENLDKANEYLDKGNHKWVLASLPDMKNVIKSQEDAASANLKRYEKIINETKKLEGQSGLIGLRSQANNLDKVIRYQRRTVALTIRIMQGIKAEPKEESKA